MMNVRRAVVNTVLVVSSLTLVACGSFGGGSSRSDDFKGRLYGGVGGLISNLDPDEVGETQFTVDDETSGGATGFLGYDVSPRFSVEGSYSDLGEATFNPAGSIDYQVAGLSALVYVLNNSRDRARREGFSLFGRAGVGYLDNDSNVVPFDRVNNFHLLLGIGAEYGLSNGLGFRLEAVSHDEDIQYGQASLLYRFGSNERRRSVPAAPRTPEVAAPRLPIPATTESTDSLVITDSTPLDSDQDGVLNTSDDCAGTPLGTPVDSAGCAFFEGAVEGINFTSGSDALTADSLTILDEVVEVLNQYPQARVAIGAHTDSQGPGEQNLQLSKGRAISVTRYLVEQGIDGSRLAPRAYGETQPRASNETKEGRAANRRVEFNLL